MNQEKIDILFELIDLYFPDLDEGTLSQDDFSTCLQEFTEKAEIELSPSGIFRDKTNKILYDFTRDYWDRFILQDFELPGNITRVADAIIFTVSEDCRNNSLPLYFEISNDRIDVFCGIYIIYGVNYYKMTYSSETPQEIVALVKRLREIFIF